MKVAHPPHTHDRTRVEQRKRELRPQLCSLIAVDDAQRQEQAKKERQLLEVLRLVGPHPMTLNLSLLGDDAPEHNLPLPCPGSQSLANESDDPYRFGNAVLMNPEDTEEGMTNPWTVNVTITWLMGLERVNMAALTLLLPGFVAHYNGRSPAGTLKTVFGPSHVRFGPVDVPRDDPPVTAAMTVCVYETGKVVITGARTRDQAMLFSHQLSLYLNRCQLPTRVLAFKVENMVATVDFGFNIDLPVLASYMKQLIDYSPGDFPAAILRFRPKPSPVALFNLSGKGVYVGHKDPEQMRDMHRRVTRIVRMYKTTAAVAHAGAADAHQRTAAQFSRPQQMLEAMETAVRLMGPDAQENQRQCELLSYEQMLELTNASHDLGADLGQLQLTEEQMQARQRLLLDC